MATQFLKNEKKMLNETISLLGFGTCVNWKLTAPNNQFLISSFEPSISVNNRYTLDKTSSFLSSSVFTFLSINAVV